MLSIRPALLLLSDFIAVLENDPTPRLCDQIGRLLRARISRYLSAANGPRGLLRKNLFDTTMGPMRTPAPFDIRPDLQMRHCHFLATERRQGTQLVAIDIGSGVIADILWQAWRQRFA